MRTVAFGVLLILSSCHVSTRTAMQEEGGRTAYNMAIQSTNSQQMLLNLVRLRYADSPLFLDVSSITTQNTFRSEVSPVFPIPGFNQENPFHLGTSLMWEDQPTITYTPLEGPAFATRLLMPIDLRTIQLLCYSGWDIDRVFRMMIQNFEHLANAPEASAPAMEQMPTYHLFTEASQLMRHFQRRGELQMGVSCKDCNDADSNETALQICFPEEGGEQAERLAELVRAEKVNGRYHKQIDLGFNQKGQLGVMPRSILSTMYYLSQGVQVPIEHVEMGMVRQPVCNDEMQTDWHKVFCELLTVRWSKECPCTAFIAVKYRNYWFYIEDCDLPSKKTFALLLQLYSLNAVSPKNRGPILSLPLR